MRNSQLIKLFLQRVPFDLLKVRRLATFHASVLKAWAKLEGVLHQPPNCMLDIRALPLTDSAAYQDTPFATLFSHFNWSKINCNVLGDLVDENGVFKTINELPTTHLSAPSTRQLQTIIKTFSLNFHQVFPEIHDEGRMNFEYIGRDSNLKPFLENKKDLYAACLQKLLPAFSLNGQSAFTDQKADWSSIYAYPIDGGDGDVTWRFLHDRLVTPVRRHLWGVQASPDCPWCTGVKGTSIHMMLECSRVERIWRIVRIFYRRINKKPSIANLLPNSLILSDKASGVIKHRS